MINKKCVIKFLVLGTTYYLNRKIHSCISGERKQELMDFLKCYSDLHFKEKGYTNWEYYLIPDEDREDDIRGIIQDVNKENDEIIADLQIMTYRAGNLFKYIEENHISFNIKGVEYYLRLYLLNRDIDKSDVIRRAILTLDIARLKVTLNSYSDYLLSLFTNNDINDKQVILFRNDLTKIYLEMKTFLKTK